MSLPQLDRAVRRAFTELCWNVGTPLSYKALKMLDRGDVVGLTSIDVRVRDYRCPRTLSGDLQIAAFFKKYPGFKLGYNLKERAIESFWSSERQCYRSNEHLSPLLTDLGHYGEGVKRVILAIRKEISELLGKCPKSTQLEPRFGPGSTFSDIGPYITVPDKMSNCYTLTDRARVHLHAWDLTAWSRYAASNLERHQIGAIIGNDEISPGLSLNHFDSCFAPRVEELTSGNRFATVPKDAKKHRGICIEPSVNLVFQLGVGTWLSKLMRRRWGWDKEIQQDFHRLLARLGSLTKGLATIDLSNASDTVCYNLVKLLLPSSWFELLSSLRSPKTFIEGRWVRLEKFSSMGNGFTFELETIIFRAIANVISASSKNDGSFHNRTVTTFGDDIICPTDTAAGVIAALRFFGFEINVGKTFINGDFRESCGGDFWKGLDMRPHHLKEEPNEPHQYIALANGLRRFGIRHILCGGPNLYRKPWLRVLDALPKQIRDCRGPEALGDLVVHDDECTWRCEVRSSIRYFRVWRPVAFGRTPWTHFRPGVVLASALYGCGDGRPTKSIGSKKQSVMDTSGVLAAKNGEYIKGYRFGRVAYS